jgi:hypothetical protein
LPIRTASSASLGLQAVTEKSSAMASPKAAIARLVVLMFCPRDSTSDLPLETADVHRRDGNP